MTDEKLSNQPLSALASDSTSSTSPIQGTTSTSPAPPQTQPLAPTAPPSSDPLDTTNELLTKQRLPLFLFCIFVAFAIVAIFFFFTRSRSQTPPPQEAPIPTTEETTPATDSSTDLPPLYPGVEWEATESGEIVFIDNAGETNTTTGLIINSKLTTTYPSEVLSYYQKELEARGWVRIQEAGGDKGEVYEFNLGDKYFTVGISLAENKDSSYYTYLHIVN